MRRLLSPLALALLGLASTSVLAAERHWTFITGCGSADWFGKPNGLNAEGKSTCWAASAGGASGQAVPGADDRVYIHHANAAADLVNTFSFAHDGAPRVGRAYELSIAGTSGHYAALAVARDTLHIGFQLTVGDQGLGKLLQTGGSVATDALTLGFEAGSLGRVELSGGELQVDHGGGLFGLLVGGGGSGQFVQTGGTLTSSKMQMRGPGPAGASSSTYFDLSGGTATFTGSVDVGIEAFGDIVPPQGGRLRISGTGSMSALRLNVATAGLLVMEGGKLRLQELSAEAGSLGLNGGVLEFTGAARYGRRVLPTQWTPLPLAYGGGVGGGTPTVRLAPGSTLNLPDLQVGDFGKGRLEVGAGAVLSTGSASLGTSKKLGLGQGTGEGAAWVAGAGAVWINNGHLALGTQGVAQLDVREGAKLRSGSAALGDGGMVDPALGRNLARIAGSGSEWKNTGDLWVGGGATGAGRASDLWVSDGALLQVGGTLTVHAGSSLIVDGGAWTAARTAIGGRIDILSNSEVQLAGALSLLTGGRLTSAAPITFRGAVNLASGAHIDTDQLLRFEGAVNLHAGATFGGEGTKVFAGGLSLDGEFVDQSTNALVVLASSNTYIAGLGGAAPDLYGRYVSSGSIRLGGTLVLVPRLGYQAVLGNAFDLFDGALSGSFDRIDVSAFALTPGLNWDFSRLNSEGVVSLTAAPIPEPGTWALWLAGLAGFGAVARRRRPAG